MDNHEIPVTKTPTFEGSVETRGTISVVHSAGEVDIASAPALAEQIDAAISTNPSQLIIDLSYVTMLDSSGLGVLITTLKRLEAQGNKTTLQLVVTEPQVLKVFAVTGLDTVFSFTSPDAAMQVTD